MKNFLDYLKKQVPVLKKQFFSSLPILLIYQALLFILEPGKINQVLLVIFIILYTTITFTKKE